MTEAEWLACDELAPMLEHLGPALDFRRLRLFACGCCRAAWDRLTNPVCRRAVEVAERFADRQTTATSLVRARRAAERQYESVPNGDRKGLDVAASWAAVDGSGYGWGSAVVCALNVRTAAEPTMAAQVELLRDIFGNPFRPGAFNPTWRTTDVTLLANGIYAERAFDRTPILADALQDAGCDAESLLAHLRDTNAQLGAPPTGSPKPPPATHVRGCWALDLVLGKE